MTELEQTKELYKAIKPPEELDSVVERAFDQARKKLHPHPLRWYQPALTLAASMCILFVILLNTSGGFAMAMEQVPVLGAIARVFTFREYSFMDSTQMIQVRMPEIANTGNTQLEARINREIQERVDTVMAEAKTRAKERQEAFVATGGEAEEFMPVIVDVDYEVKCSTEQTLSFVVYETETQANAYTEEYFYNLDLETGEELTLPGLLGNGWKELCNQQIQEQMKARESARGEEIFFPVEMGGFQGVQDGQRFYINQDGNVVISFQKYEVAPGSEGIQDFEIVVE